MFSQLIIIIIMLLFRAVTAVGTAPTTPVTCFTCCCVAASRLQDTYMLNILVSSIDVAASSLLVAYVLLHCHPYKLRSQWLWPYCAGGVLSISSVKLLAALHVAAAAALIDAHSVRIRCVTCIAVNKSCHVGIISMQEGRSVRLVGYIVAFSLSSAHLTPAIYCVHIVLGVLSLLTAVQSTSHEGRCFCLTVVHGTCVHAQGCGACLMHLAACLFALPFMLLSCCFQSVGVMQPLYVVTMQTPI
jgi:hypothetical protein